jgi:hypothetical protein
VQTCSTFLTNSHSSICPSSSGDVAHLQLPARLKELNIENCKSASGDVGSLVLPKGIQNVNFKFCPLLSGRYSKYFDQHFNEFMGPLQTSFVPHFVPRIPLFFPFVSSRFS